MLTSVLTQWIQSSKDNKKHCHMVIIFCKFVISCCIVFMKLSISCISKNHVLSTFQKSNLLIIQFYDRGLLKGFCAVKMNEINVYMFNMFDWNGDFVLKITKFKKFNQIPRSLMRLHCKF